MEFPIIINWTCPFIFQGLLGCIFHFYQNSNRTLCKQTVEPMIRHHVQPCLIWVCTVYLCPTKRMLGLNGLKDNIKLAKNVEKGYWLSIEIYFVGTN